MNLAQAFRLLNPYQREEGFPVSGTDLTSELIDGPGSPGLITSVAFVGAGGKTTAMFELARQLPPPVIITTTTHLGFWQLEFADRHVVVKHQGDVKRLSRDDLEGVVIITGGQVEQDRVSGLDEDSITILYNFAKMRGGFLLIEADGSRQRPLKAPEKYEPVIPEFVDLVIVVVGLSGLNKPLTKEWVHRPGRFAELAGLGIGEDITVESLVRVLTHSQGGLKDVPPDTRRLALLNQADSASLQALAQNLTSDLLPVYDSVVVASSRPHSLSPNSKKVTQRKTNAVVAPCEMYVHAVHEPTAGVILAAGSAKRMGKPKQLLPWRGQPLIRHAVTAALAAGLTPVNVVLGAYEDQVRSVLAGLPVEFVLNVEWERGQSSSMKAGLRAIPQQSGSVVFLLADQPRVSIRLVKALVEQHAITLAPILAPIIDGKRANPVLFDRLTFEDLLDVEGDIGGRAIFSNYPVSWMDWYDSDVNLDIDTEADYQRLLENDE